MSFDFSSRFLYTLEAPFRTFFLFVAFTLFFFFDISGSDKQPSFVLFRSQFQFLVPDFFVVRNRRFRAHYYRRMASIRAIIGCGSQAWGSQRSFSSKPHLQREIIPCPYSNSIKVLGGFAKLFPQNQALSKLHLNLINIYPGPGFTQPGSKVLISISRSIRSLTGTRGRVPRTPRRARPSRRSCP